MAYKSRLPVLSYTVIISVVVVALQLVVVESASRQEQEILLLDALSRKYSQSSSSSSQFEQNSIMDMLGRSTQPFYCYSTVECICIWSCQHFRHHKRMPFK